MKLVRLLSCKMMHTPGLVRYFKVAYQTGDKKVARMGLIEGYGLSKAEAEDILRGKIETRVVGDVVEFDSPYREGEAK